MFEFISSVFNSKDFSVQDKTFIKSFVLAFPLSYVNLVDAKFANYDVFNRCMITISDTIISFIFSIIFLFMLSRIEKQRSRDSIYFFLAPIFLQVGGLSFIQSLVFTFLPFIIYAMLIRFLRYANDAIQ